VETYALIAEEPAAPPAPNGEQGPKGFDWSLIIMMALIFGVFYLIVWRPQSKKRKEEQKKRDEMLKNLKKSDHVMTIGGIHGVVSSVGESEVVLKVDERSDVRIRMARNAINKVVGPEGEPVEKKDQ
jgi:preprotein translocase subunit YajC